MTIPKTANIKWSDILSSSGGKYPLESLEFCKTIDFSQIRYSDIPNILKNVHIALLTAVIESDVLDRKAIHHHLISCSTIDMELIFRYMPKPILDFMLDESNIQWKTENLIDTMYYIAAVSYHNEGRTYTEFVKTHGMRKNRALDVVYGLSLHSRELALDAFKFGMSNGLKDSHSRIDRYMRMLSELNEKKAYFPEILMDITNIKNYPGSYYELEGKPHVFIKKCRKNDIVESFTHTDDNGLVRIEYSLSLMYNLGFRFMDRIDIHNQFAMAC